MFNKFLFIYLYMRYEYAVIAHPNSGSLSIDEKVRELQQLIENLGPNCDREIHAIRDPPDEFSKCAKHLEDRVDKCLVVAGGDGALQIVINTVNPELPLALFPLGTCNVIIPALKLPRSRGKITHIIKEGSVHELDLISCNGYKGFTSAVGIEGYVLEERERLKQNGINGLAGYILAAIKEISRLFEGTDTITCADGNISEFKNMITVLVSKHPYYGMGLKVNPKAKLTDGKLHLTFIRQSFPEIAYAILTSFFTGNRAGEYIECNRARITTNRDLPLHIDGNVLYKGKEFEFQVLPKAVKMIY